MPMGVKFIRALHLSFHIWVHPRILMGSLHEAHRAESITIQCKFIDLQNFFQEQKVLQ